MWCFVSSDGEVRQTCAQNSAQTEANRCVNFTHRLPERSYHWSRARIWRWIRWAKSMRSRVEIRPMRFEDLKILNNESWTAILGAPFVTSNIQILLRSRLVVGRYEKLRTGVKRNMFNTRSLPKHNWINDMYIPYKGAREIERRKGCFKVKLIICF